MWRLIPFRLSGSTLPQPQTVGPGRDDVTLSVETVNGSCRAMSAGQVFLKLAPVLKMNLRARYWPSLPAAPAYGSMLGGCIGPFRHDYRRRLVQGNRFLDVRLRGLFLFAGAPIDHIKDSSWNRGDLLSWSVRSKALFSERERPETCLRR